MGEVSGRLADLTIITSDNPRFEKPQDIIDDIKIGIGKTDGKYVEIIDRKEKLLAPYLKIKPTSAPQQPVQGAQENSAE
jgi:UDP-N-acetylmuramyl tripeptide synthase